MVTIKLNLKPVVKNLQAKLNILKDKEYLLRPVALDRLDDITKRIHDDGLASDGQPIGTYSKGYMAVRTGVFKSNGVYQSGPRKGQHKNTGVFTKGVNKGAPRPRYNRTSDTRVIASLTRQLENGYAVIATEKGYGIGFLNPDNFDKSQRVQETYKKRIFDLTAAELQASYDQIDQLIKDAFNKTDL